MDVGQDGNKPSLVDIGRRHTFYVNDTGERFNLVALHRLNLQHIRQRLLDEAGDVFKDGHLKDDHSRTITALMQDYCNALRDREYMREWAHRDWDRNPFVLKSERELERNLLDGLKSRGVHPAAVVSHDEDRIGPALPAGPWDVPSVIAAHRERYISAILGALVLIVPMLIMALVKRLDASLCVVSICTIAFAVALSYFAPTRLPIELFSATAAYAAVLVVFVSGFEGQSG